jgi:LEA14-like dessication related protein
MKERYEVTVDRPVDMSVEEMKKAITWYLRNTLKSKVRVRRSHRMYKGNMVPTGTL